MARVTADHRLRRILAIVPWVAAQGGPRVEAVCARFGCTEAELRADLELLFLCGVHPYTPDSLIDVDFHDGRVWIRFADWFARPLRLTPAEGLVLVAAGSALLAVPGADPDGPLARGLAKLAAVLGIDPDEAVGVQLGAATTEILRTLQEAAAEHRLVEMDYYAYGRDSSSVRTVEPRSVFSAEGQWYLAAHCHQARGERLFRVDRVRAARALDARFAPPARRQVPAPASVYSPRPQDPEVVLELEPAGRWVAEQYPHEALEELGQGRARVRLRVSERPWLERLLLRLGPDGQLVDGDDPEVDSGIACGAARRVLARYR